MPQKIFSYTYLLAQRWENVHYGILCQKKFKTTYKSISGRVNKKLEAYSYNGIWYSSTNQRTWTISINISKSQELPTKQKKQDAEEYIYVYVYICVYIYIYTPLYHLYKLFKHVIYYIWLRYIFLYNEYIKYKDMHKRKGKRSQENIEKKVKWKSPVNNWMLNG